MKRHHFSCSVFRECDAGGSCGELTEHRAAKLRVMTTPQPQVVPAIQSQGHWAAGWDGSSAPSLLNTLQTKAFANKGL